jgi:ketosteroid isomerase-like protein
MDTKAVGKRLVELCRQGQNIQAMEELYDANIVSVEAVGDETMPAEMRGIEAIRGKAKWWYDNHEIHRGEARGPYPQGDRFAVYFNYEVTAKGGPMAGRRFTIEEVGLYTVRGGKIVREEFFYDMDG